MAISPAIITTDFPCSGKPVWAIAATGVVATDIADGTKWRQEAMGSGSQWVLISKNNIYQPPAGGAVNSVTGLDTDNTDPVNPIVKISVDGTSVTGQGTPGSPLSANAATTPDASTTVKGITKLSTAPVSPTIPIAVGDNDPRNSNARTPTAHAATHTNGTDDIQLASGSQKGILSSSDWSTFNSKLSSVPDSSTTVKGITKLSVAPVSPTDPIAVGDNDPRNTNARTPTAHAASHVDGSDDIQLASASQKGLLSSTDWSTFNSKLGSVPDASTTVKGVTKLSVAPVSPTDPIAVGDNDPRNTNARTPTAHAATHTNGSDDIQLATGAQKGILSSTDWTTFNGKLTPNTAITGATKTKVTYDTKGLVTSGADATTTDIAEGSNLYFTDERAQDAVGNNVGAGLAYDDPTAKIYVSLPLTTKTADFTLALADAWTSLDVNSSSFVTGTIPTNATVAFPIGTSIYFCQIGAAQLTLAAAVGVTLISPSSYVSTRVTGSTIRAYKSGTNTWEISGDVGVFVGYDTDATTFFNAVAALGGSFTTAAKGYMNAFFLAMKATGSLYTKTHFCHLYVGGTIDTIKLNIVNPVDADANFRLTATGSPTIDGNGATFNGTTQYLNTHYIPSTSANQNSKCYAFYLRTVGTGSNYGAVDAGFKGDAATINFAGTIAWALSLFYDTSASTPATIPGFWLFNRTTSTAAEVRQNDVSKDTNGATTDTNINGKILIGGRNNAGTPGTFSADNVCFDWGGASLSSAEATALEQACNALQTSLARNVY